MNWSLGRPWEASGIGSELEQTGASGGLGRPRALGVSWSKLEPWEASGGLGSELERTGASGGLGRPRALGASWSELEPQEALGGLGPWE